MWPLTFSMPNSAEGFVVSLSYKFCATMELLYSTNKRYKAKFLRDLEASKA